MHANVPGNLLTLRFPPEVYERIPRLRTVNVVATYNVSSSTIDPNWIMQRLPGCASDPQQFAAVKLRYGNTMMRVFSRGRAVCPGAENVWDARNTAVRLCLRLQSIGEIVSFRHMQLQNIVVNVNAGFNVDLPRLASEYSINTKYEPDNFPGLVFMICEPKNTKFLVFLRGGVIIAGNRSEEDARCCWAWFYTNILLKYRDANVLSTSSAQFRYQDNAKNDTLVEDCRVLSQRSTRSQTRSGSLLPSVSVPATPSRAPTITNRKRGRSPPTKRAEPAAKPTLDVDAAALRSLEFLYYHRPECAYRSQVVRADYHETEMDRVNAVLCGMTLPDMTARSLVEPHVKTGCVSADALRSDQTCLETLRVFSSELTMFVQSANEKDPVQVPKQASTPDKQQVDPMYLYDPVEAHRIAVLRGDYASDDEAEIEAINAFREPIAL